MEDNELPALDINTLKSELEQFAYRRKGWKLVCNVIGVGYSGDVDFPTAENDVVEYLAKMSLTHNIVRLRSHLEWLEVSFDSSKDHTTNIDSEVIELVVSLVHR